MNDSTQTKLLKYRVYNPLFGGGHVIATSTLNAMEKIFKEDPSCKDALEMKFDGTNCSGEDRYLVTKKDPWNDKAHSYHVWYIILDKDYVFVPNYN
jgi:hypothetical protein